MKIYYPVALIRTALAEDPFIELFSETYGAEKAGHLYSQYHFCDIYQNSMVYLGWDVYRWAAGQMQTAPEAMKDELRVFLGNHLHVKEIKDTSAVIDFH